MTKRLLALFLVCILAIPIMALPASATTVDYQILEEVETIRINVRYIYEYLNDWIYTSITNVSTTIEEWGLKLHQHMSQLTGSTQTYLIEMSAKLDDIIDALLTGSDADQENATEIENEVATQESQFNDSQEIIQEATRPDIEDVKVDFSGDNKWKDSGYLNIIRWMFNHPLSGQPTPLFYILFYAMTLSLVSFGIFGKR